MDSGQGKSGFRVGFLHQHNEAEQEIRRVEVVEKREVEPVVVQLFQEDVGDVLELAGVGQLMIDEG